MRLARRAGGSASVRDRRALRCQSHRLTDHDLKRALCARHGIPELWIVNLVDGIGEVRRSPGPDGYASVATAGRTGVLEPKLLSGARIKVVAKAEPRSKDLQKS